MLKRALCAVAGFLSLCLPLFAQQIVFPDVFSALNYSSLRLPSLTLSDGQFFSFPSEFSYVETTTPPDFLPALPAMAPQKATGAFYAASPKDSSKEVVEVQPPNFGYAGGEVGALYGRSTGKFGREFEQGYIVGTVGDDKFQITAGASYEHSSGRVPRFGR